MVLALDHSGSFTRVATQRKTKVSVGFEWEIPAEIREGECTCDDDYYEDEDGCHYECSYCCGEDEDYVDTNDTTEGFIESHGFRTHIECGGVEFASPVFGNIATARRVADVLKGVALQDRAFESDPDEACCGIHVHTGFTGWNTNPRRINGIPADVHNAYEQVTGMLNRKSSSKFIYEFSGRDKGRSPYKRQGESTCWDRKGAKQPSDRQRTDMRCNSMVRPNCFGSTGTVEYRLWYAAENRLIPALEFAHACTTFITKRKGIPYIKDFKVWLDKQSGYKVLKQDNAWRLI